MVAAVASKNQDKLRQLYALRWATAQTGATWAKAGVALIDLVADVAVADLDQKEARAAKKRGMLEGAREFVVSDSSPDTARVRHSLGSAADWALKQVDDAPAK